MPRLHVDLTLAPGLEASLPAGAARHVQVLRLQPGDSVTLFDGHGSDWPAQILHMGRSDVTVRVGEPVAVARELPLRVTLAIGMPANDRMDWLVEKATELGAAAIEPLMCERSVLRLSGERADKRVAHWRGIAAAAAEQCGRARLPAIGAPRGLGDWLRERTSSGETRLVLSLADGTTPLREALVAAPSAMCLLSGPEGGLSPAEDEAARAAGWRPVTLGDRILRAETAPLAALAAAGLFAATP